MLTVSSRAHGGDVVNQASKSRLITVLLLLVISVSAQAELEPWYTFWSLGISDHSNEAALESFIDDARNMPGSFTHGEVATDTFGFYWPLHDNILVGFVLSGTSEILSSLDTDEPDNWGEFFTGFPYVDGASDYLVVRQTLYAASAMRFYGDEPGDGFFLRGDAGVATLEIETELPSPIKDDTGYGLLVGAGYGIPVSGESRLLIGITCSYNEIGGHRYKATALRISGLW